MGFGWEQNIMRKFIGILAALALGAAAFAPAADARDHGGRYGGGYYGGHRGYYHDDHGDAVAAGVLGLVLGVAIASAASEPRRDPCYDNYRRCAPPPPPQYRQGYYQGGYYQDPRYADPRYADPRYADPRYADPRYADPRYDQGSAYDQDYGNDGPPPQSQCTRRERQYDRYAQRYVTVDVPC